MPNSHWAVADLRRTMEQITAQRDALLEACELAREQLEYVVNGWEEMQGTRVSWALGKVSDAIAKAKGE